MLKMLKYQFFTHLDYINTLAQSLLMINLQNKILKMLNKEKNISNIIMSKVIVTAEVKITRKFCFDLLKSSKISVSINSDLGSVKLNKSIK